MAGIERCAPAADGDEFWVYIVVDRAFAKRVFFVVI
jgi:hypothetical protein